MVLVARRSLVALLLAAWAGVLIVPQQAAAADLPEVTAESAIVVDAVTGQVLFDKSANTPHPPASLTKLFTAFAALEVASMDRPMTVTGADLVGEASMGLTEGERLPFEVLLHGMLLPSGNDAASTIARNLSAQASSAPAPTIDAFMAYLSGRTSELGLRGTTLANPHGLDQDGHRSTARDIAAMTIYAMATEPAFAQAIAATSYSRYGHQLVQTNELHASYPGLIGGKTGVTEDAGYCLMEVAERDGHRVVVVLLGSTPQDWYSDARLLLDYGFTAASTPGSPVFGQIAFQPQSAVASGNTNAVDNLAVSFPTAGSAVVSSSATVSDGPFLHWLGVLSVFVVVPCLAVIAVQTRKLVLLTQVHSARRVLTPVATEPAWNTHPFRSIGQSSLLTNDGAVYSRAASRDAREHQRPSVAPSFGD